MYTFGGLSIFIGSIKDVVYRVGTWISQRKSSYVCVTGVHGFVEAQRSPLVMEAHKQSGLVVPDGMPLVWLGKIFGHKDTKRIYGPDLMLEICKEAQQKRWRVFLYGTTPKTLLLLEKRLLNLFPKLKIVGRSAPPFRALSKNEESRYIKEINISDPDLLLVGLSTPKQELWMHDNVGKIHSAVLVGVGAAFDFIAGTKKQAPQWMRGVGLEWLYRFIQEPQRLGKRYASANTFFVLSVLRALPHYYWLIPLFITSVILSIHESGVWGIIGVGGIFILEFYYFGIFVLSFWQRSFSRLLALGGVIISLVTYGLLFRYINSLELWVDEIQVIRFGQLPLYTIAREVMTKHVAVPPLDYWNMWLWDKMVSPLPISIYEFVYRIPYMATHTFSAILLAYVLWQFVVYKTKWFDISIVCVGFLIYFFSPLPFVYSYEIRFYSMMLLGAIVTVYLFYSKKLYSARYVPLVLLFCLNSAYQYIILVPFVIKGLTNPVSRRGAALLGIGCAFVSIIVLPFLYIPNAISAINPRVVIEGGLSWLTSLYFVDPWRQVVAGIVVLVALILRRKDVSFLTVAIALYIGVIALLDVRYNYRYFGGKHFIFIIPFCTVLVFEFFRLSQNKIVRIIALILICILFFPPFYSFIYALQRGEIMIAKSPIGLKRVFEFAVQKKASDVIFAYDSFNDEDIQYNLIGIHWYADLNSEIKVHIGRREAMCVQYTNSPKSIIYYFPMTNECAISATNYKEVLFDGIMATKAQ